MELGVTAPPNRQSAWGTAADDAPTLDLGARVTQLNQLTEVARRLLVDTQAGQHPSIDTVQGFLIPTLEHLSRLARDAEGQVQVAISNANLKPLPPGINKGRYTPWGVNTTKEIARSAALLAAHQVAPGTLKQYKSRFEHWRIFRHNRYGSGTSPWIVNRTSLEAEEQCIEFLCWLYSIGNSTSAMQGKFVAVSHIHVCNGLGRPFALMDRLKKFNRAYGRLRGREGVPKCRLSIEFMRHLLTWLTQQGNLVDLAVAAAVSLGWSLILRVQNYVAWYDPITKELDLDVTLTDKDVKIFWDKKLVPFEKVGTITRPLAVGVVRIQAVIGGGKTSTASPFRRNCFSTGLEVCFATQVLNYLTARMEAGILVEADLPFFRVGNLPRDFVSYSTVNSAIKTSAVQQNINPIIVATHSIRAGGADNSYQAEGYFKTKIEGNWGSDCAKRYMDLASRDPKKTARMVSTATTNAESVEAHRVSNSFRAQQSAYLGDDTASPVTEVTHGLEHEAELRGLIGASWADGGVTYRLVSVSTHDLEVMHRNTIRMETHVVGCYVETQQYRSLEEAPYGAIEWSTAGEVLGWINEHRAVTSNDPRSLADTVI